VSDTRVSFEHTCCAKHFDAALDGNQAECWL